MRLEALEVRLDIICAGSEAAELASSVAEAWDWCAVDSHPDDPERTVQRLTVQVERDPEMLAGSAGVTS